MDLWLCSLVFLLTDILDANIRTVLRVTHDTNWSIYSMGAVPFEFSISAYAKKV